jgi:hypothetical protein
MASRIFGRAWSLRTLTLFLQTPGPVVLFAEQL